MARLVRSNDDPKLLADLELLAREYGPAEGALLVEERGDAQDEPAPDAPTATEAEAATATDRAALGDPFVRTFVKTSYHLRRYFPYYLGAAAWLLVMLLMSPVGSGPAGDDLAEFAGPSTLEDTGTVESAFQDTTAVVPDFTSSTQGASDFLAFSEAEDIDTSSDFGDSDADFESDFTDDFSTDTTVSFADEPQPLRIVRTAYSSRTAGTPFEQEPPGGGLPVAAAAGQSGKRSFIALSGDETLLRLKLVDDPSAAVGAEGASVRVCPIVNDGWQPVRGAAYDSAEEPDFAGPCIPGVRADDGTWSWDLSSFAHPGESAGFALTTTSDDLGASFSLVFDPKALSD